MRVAGPHLRAVDQPAALGPRGSGGGGEQIRAGARLAHPDGKAHFSATDTPQYVRFDALARIFDQHRTALAVGNELQPHRRIGGTEFLGHDVTLEKAAFMPTVLLGPGHADPALGPDLAAELGTKAVIVPRLLGIEGAGGDFLLQEGAHLGAERLALGWQADRVKAQCARHLPFVLTAMPAAAITLRRHVPLPGLPIAPPRHSRCQSRRARPIAVA